MSAANKKQKKARRNVFAVFMGIIWGAIIIALFVSVVRIFVPETYSYYSGVTVLNYLASEQYGEFYIRVSDRLTDGNDYEDMNAYNSQIATVEYIQSAGMYKIYKENGVSEKEQYYMEMMESASQRMGDLSFVKDEVDKMLLLTE